jgi:hypothetical protein
MAQNYPSYPVNYQQAEAKNSGALKWIVITLICIALVSGAISAMVISAIRAKQTASEQAHDELSKDDRLAETAPPPPPAAPPPPSTHGAGLEHYKYPNANVENTSKVFGIETLKMTTSDSVSEVRDYYKERLGDPMLEDDDSAAVFQIPGPPMVIITINQGEQDSDKTEIKVVRTNSQLPRMN